MNRTTRRATDWTDDEEAALAPLDSPGRIQAFLDAVPYSPDPIYRSPRSVLRDRKAHCFDGALFAANALSRIGIPPLLVDLRAVRDDDHILAVYRRDGLWGAVAKSNFSGLRLREPLYRSLRELALSYFEDYYNLEGLKSLREYSVPLDLGTLEGLAWRTSDDRLEEIAARLDSIRHYRLLTPAQEAALLPVDERSFQAGMVGVSEDGLYVPGDPAHEARKASIGGAGSGGRS